MSDLILQFIGYALLGAYLFMVPIAYKMGRKTGFAAGWQSAKMLFHRPPRRSETSNWRPPVREGENG